MNIEREQDSEGRRWYYTPDGQRYMSVTTVLNELEEDTTGLDIWKERNDGRGDNAHHEHLYWYSGPRGTLCHYQALVKFEDAHDAAELWGKEESESMKKMVNGPRPPEPCADHSSVQDDCADCFGGAFNDASHDNGDVVYSILNDHDVVQSRDEFEHLFADTTRIMDVLRQDVDYFVETFEKVCDVLGITEESVITVEKFMLNDLHGYGGQTDLVYEDPEGNVVVSDLKTSSSLREKHRLQAVAYAKAIEYADDVDVDDVDRVEVIRIHPTSQTWTVHSHEVPEHVSGEPNYTDEYWFKDKWGDFEYDSLSEMWETFKNLARQAHDHAAADD